MRASRFILGIAALAAGSLEAQQSSRTQPVTGLRDNSTGYHALVGARVVTALARRSTTRRSSCGTASSPRWAPA
ncbi:MAG: hypothetical protein IPP20_05160 [Gemmatimonadetes bacterium]|nr:hypothetical protein [Gemmatimonadota bacterium]